MRACIRATGRFFGQIANDAMIFMLLFVPIAIGLLFKFGVPALESWLCARLSTAAVLTPYYPIFDLLLAAVTPIMAAASGAMVVLDEMDSGVSRALAVTPIGRLGYIASRIAIPCAISTVYCVLVMAVFSLSDMSASRILAISACSGALGVAAAVMVPALARNKVEGMAYTKLSGLFMLGLPAALLVPAPVSHIAGILPPYWMTRLIMGGGAIDFLLAIVTSIAWTWLFARRYMRKLL